MLLSASKKVVVMQTAKAAKLCVCIIVIVFIRKKFAAKQAHDFSV